MIMDIQDVINWFPQSAAWLLIFAGFVALTWLGYERKRKQGFFKIKKEEWETTDVSKFLRVLSYFGIALGIIMVWAAIVGMINGIPPSFKYGVLVANDFDWVTSISCIVVGLVLIMKPINDLPWSGILGLFAGIASAILISLYIPDSWAANPDAKWVILIIAIIVATLVGVSVKFWIGSIQMISKFLSYPPLALLLSAYCFIQGVMVLGLGYGLGNLGAV